MGKRSYPLSNFMYALKHDIRTLRSVGGSLKVADFHKECSRLGYEVGISSMYMQSREGIKSLDVADRYAHVFCYGYGVDIHPKDLIGIRARSYRELKSIEKEYAIADLASERKRVEKDDEDDWSKYI